MQVVITLPLTPTVLSLQSTTGHSLTPATGASQCSCKHSDFSSKEMPPFTISAVVQDSVTKPAVNNYN